MPRVCFTLQVRPDRGMGVLVLVLDARLAAAGEAITAPIGETS